MAKSEIAGAVMLFLLGLLLGVVSYNTMRAADRSVDTFAQGGYVIPATR